MACELPDSTRSLRGSVRATFCSLQPVNLFSWNFSTHRDSMSEPCHGTAVASARCGRSGRSDGDHVCWPTLPHDRKRPANHGQDVDASHDQPCWTCNGSKTLTAHRVFEHHVLEALKQWRFKTSDRDHVLEVICLFEFDIGKCEGTDLHPATSETYVWADLPSVVHIRTGLQCIERVDP